MRRAHRLHASLGEAGKQLGQSSTLPPAQRLLEFAGRVERTLEGGRLDSERYLWRIPDANPWSAGNVPPMTGTRIAGWPSSSFAERA